MMEKTYRPYDRDQLFLLPPALQDWLAEDHLVYFLADLVDQLDLSAITTVYEQERRGYPPYHPRMMTTLLLYAYTVGTPSSRRIAQRCQEDVAFRVLTANQTPDFRTISDFRKRHLPALQALFVQVLRCCQRAGLVKLGTVALDGTKLRANASKHKAMSYGRMQPEVARLEAEVRALLAQAEATDAAEDARYGADRRGDELPAELARRETRLATIRAAMAALEAEGAAAAPE
ncbi:MAG: transposase, partial [Candidatus Methylomirabilales bacterium]